MIEMQSFERDYIDANFTKISSKHSTFEYCDTKVW